MRFAKCYKREFKNGVDLSPKTKYKIRTQHPVNQLIIYIAKAVLSKVRSLDMGNMERKAREDWIPRILLYIRYTRIIGIDLTFF
jgi:hypothetical protein